MNRCNQIRRNGAVLVLVAILLPVLLILSSMAINYAYLDLCEAEIYTAADAAARAAGREFTMTRNQSASVLRGKSIANLNTVAGTGLTLADSDFTFGRSTRGGLGVRYSLDAAAAQKNSVKVVAKRTTSSPSGPIPLFMPNILGRSSVNLSETSVSTSIDVDVALVLDRSGSMAYASDEIANAAVSPYSAPTGWQFCDPAPPICRWRNLQTAVDFFLTEAANSPMDELISLSTYNHLSATDVSLANNFSQIAAGLVPYTNSLCAGGTNIGAGIHEGIGSLSLSPNARPYAAKVIVVMTDGIHNIGTHPIDAAYYAASQGIVLFTVTFANEADQWLMQQVAAIGGGRHYHANSPADLNTAFQDIARSLPTILTQ